MHPRSRSCSLKGNAYFSIPTVQRVSVLRAVFESRCGYIAKTKIASPRCSCDGEGGHFPCGITCLKNIKVICIVIHCSDARRLCLLARRKRPPRLFAHSLSMLCASYQRRSKTENILGCCKRTLNNTGTNGKEFERIFPPLEKKAN